MIKSNMVYKKNCFDGLINNHIFQIIKIGKENSKTTYVTVKDLNTGNISQTNYDTFIRLQLKECKHPDEI